MHWILIPMSFGIVGIQIYHAWKGPVLESQEMLRMRTKHFARLRVVLLKYYFAMFLIHL